MDDWLEDMIHDIRSNSFNKALLYDTLCSDKEKPLYPGCKKITQLLEVLRLFNLTAKNRWINKSFTKLLELLKDMLP